MNNSFVAHLLMDSDDEDYNGEQPSISRKRIRDTSNPLEMTNKKFITTFRLNKEAFIYVLEAIQDNLKTNVPSTSIPNILKLAGALRFYGEGGYQRGTGRDRQIGFAQPTMCVVLDEITSAIEDNLCARWIQLNMTEQEKQESKQYFFQKTGFPGVIGCIDGTFIQIMRPYVNEHLFFSRKGTHKINSMMICDYTKKIRYVNAQYGGASHDSVVYNASNARAFLSNMYESGDHSSWILGDSGYPLEPWIITPYRAAAENSREAYFNHKHSQTRNIVERSFGLLKQRFRCVLSERQLHYQPQKVTKIINVCCALHNICIHYNVPFQVDSRIVYHNEEENIEIDENSTNLARTIRDRIRDSFI